MNKKLTCYCGLYCGNCPVKTKVEPAARTLHQEMSRLGFEQIMSFFPDGENFWSFLKGMINNGICVSCRAGSGNPTCKVRPCAQKKKIEMCAFCENYPCELFTEIFKAYPTLKRENSILKKQGWKAWNKLQDERQKANEDFECAAK